MTSVSKKWQISLFSLALFILVVNPMTYKLTNRLLGGLVGRLADVNGSPTTLGLIVHSVVFLLLVRFSMDLDLF
jgi:arginine exporter protein ArgO